MTDDLSDRATDTLTPAQAAVRLGVSERTIWRRIKAGKLDTEHTPDGVRVLVTDTVSVADRQVTDKPSSLSDTVTDTPQPAPELMKALEMVDRLHQETTEQAEKIAELTGAAAHWQTRAMVAEEQARKAEEQVKLLMAPKDDPAPEPAQPERRPWWKRLLGS